MMSHEDIRQLSLERAEKAAAEGKQPYVVEAGDVGNWQRGVAAISIPCIGDYVPDGWQAVRDKAGDEVCYFVDKTGWGEEGDPALTLRAFVAKLEPGYGYAVVEEGSLQMHVMKFERVAG